MHDNIVNLNLRVGQVVQRVKPAARPLAWVIGLMAVGVAAWRGSLDGALWTFGVAGVPVAVLASVPWWYDNRSQIGAGIRRARKVGRFAARSVRWVWEGVIDVVAVGAIVVDWVVDYGFRVFAAERQRAPLVRVPRKDRVSPGSVLADRMGVVAGKAAGVLSRVFGLDSPDRQLARAQHVVAVRWAGFLSDHAQCPAAKVGTVQLVNGGFQFGVKMIAGAGRKNPQPVADLLQFEAELRAAFDGHRGFGFAMEPWRGSSGCTVTVLAKNPLKLMSRGSGVIVPSWADLPSPFLPPDRLPHTAPVEIGRDTEGHPVTIVVEPGQDVSVAGLKGQGKGNAATIILADLLWRTNTYVSVMDCEKNPGEPNDYEDAIPGMFAFIGAEDVQTHSARWLAAYYDACRADARRWRGADPTKVTGHVHVLLVDNDKALPADAQAQLAKIVLHGRAAGIAVIRMTLVNSQAGRSGAEAKDASVQSSTLIHVGAALGRVVQMTLGFHPDDADMQHLKSLDHGTALMVRPRTIGTVRFLFYFAGKVARTRFRAISTVAVRNPEFHRLHTSSLSEFLEGLIVDDSGNSGDDVVQGGADSRDGDVPLAVAPRADRGVPARGIGADTLTVGAPVGFENDLNYVLPADSTKNTRAVWALIVSNGRLGKAEAQRQTRLGKHAMVSAVDPLIAAGIVSVARNAQGHVEYVLAELPAVTEEVV